MNANKVNHGFDFNKWIAKWVFFFFFFEINNTIKGVIMKMKNYKMEIHTKGVIVYIIIHMN